MAQKTHLYMTLYPDVEGSTMKYNTGEVNAVISLERGLKINDAYRFCLYNEELMLIDYAESNDQQVSRCGRSFSVTFLEEWVYTPGVYLLLMHCTTTGVTLRGEVVLDEQATFSNADMDHCDRMSDEAMLIRPLYDQKIFWGPLSRNGGVAPLKRWLLQQCRQKEVNALRSGLVTGELSFSNNLLIASPTMSLMTHNAMLLKLIVGMPGEKKTIDCATLYDPTLNAPYERLNEVVSTNSAKDEMSELLDPKKEVSMTLYHIGALMENGGRHIVTHLSAHWSEAGSGTVVCGTQQEINSLLEQYPSLQRFFPQENRIAIGSYTLEEIIQRTYAHLLICHLELTPEALNKLCVLLEDAHRQGITAHWDFHDIRRLVQYHIQPRYCQRLMDRPDHPHLLSWIKVQTDDLDGQMLARRSTGYEEALAELNAMVGLDEIKQSLTTQSHRMHFYVERRRFGLTTTDGTAHHAIFTGSPGTGKTTVARLLGKIYHSLGLLSRGEVISVDRSKLIGRYVGETEENMKHVLQEARGNVLFIDEAYTLYSKDGNDFGRHVIDSLLTVLSQKEPDMLIIFAGYESEMDKLMSMNPGLVGRFPYKYRFSDYSADELMQIALNIFTRDEYVLTDEATALLRQCINESVRQHSGQFGNARWAEQLVRNGIIPALADRLATTPHAYDRQAYQCIEAVDVERAYERFNPKTIELKPRRQVGFSA